MQLNVALVFKTAKREHRIFAATERLICYECGAYGHTRQYCPDVKKTYATVTRADPPVHVTENVENESRVEQESVPERQGTVKKGADEVHRYSVNNEITSMAVNRVNDESADVPVSCVTDTEENSQPAEEMIVDIGLRKPLKRSFLNTGKEDEGNKVLVVQVENTPNDVDSEQSGESRAAIMPPAHDEKKGISESRHQTCKSKSITDGQWRCLHPPA